MRPRNRVSIGSLFSGAGALCELAIAPLLGGRVAWHCEYEPPTKGNPTPSQAAARLLKHRFPGTPNLGDITEVDWSSVPPVRVLCGGFPCTDVSSAGKRLGLRPDTRSGLWSHMAYAIGHLRPELVVIENVRGLASSPAHSDVEPCSWCLGDGPDIVALRALGAVLGDLADLGYDAVWQGLRASDVGAPHPRFRFVVLASPADAAGPRWGPLESVDVRPDLGEADGAGQAEPGRRRGVAAHPDRAGRVGPRLPRSGLRVDDRPAIGRDDPVHLLPTPRASDGTKGGPSRRGSSGDLMPPSVVAALAVDWGKYAEAIERWARVLGRPAPHPTITGQRGGKKLNPALTEWLMGWPAGWVTEVPGLTPNEQLRLCGNGVVPQQIQAAVRYLLPMLSAEGRAA